LFYNKLKKYKEALEKSKYLVNNSPSKYKANFWILTGLIELAMENNEECTII